VRNLQKGIEDGSRAIRGIRPAVLDDSGLSAAVEDLIDQFARVGMTVTFAADLDVGRLPERVQTTVFRVMQEALNNAKKHSGAKTVRINLYEADERLRLEVQDSGCGFDVAVARSSGFGLHGMVERVRLLGGECTITSRKGAGTCVTVDLPLANTLE
jgi:signal transduction histidine kinase